MNVTDIDDKIIRGAAAEGVSIAELAERYTARFLADADALGMTRPDVLPRATAHIPQISASSRRCSSGTTPTAPRTGPCSSGSRRGPPTGAWRASTPRRCESASGSRPTSTRRTTSATSPSGRASSRASHPGTRRSGPGRPGWHIECSAMSMAHLGPSFDIHTGGVDLVFPHHEDELAQSEAATGQPFVRTWLHCAHLRMGGEKMAKSTGNIERVADLVAAGVSPRALRYRADRGPLPRAAQLHGGVAAGGGRRRRAGGRTPGRPGRLPRGPPRRPELPVVLDGVRAGSRPASMTTSTSRAALAALFDGVRELNRRIDARALSTADAARATALIRELDGVLGDRGAGRRRPGLLGSRRCWTRVRPRVPGATGRSRTAFATSCSPAGSPSRTRATASAGARWWRRWLTDSARATTRTARAHHGSGHAGGAGRGPGAARRPRLPAGVARPAMAGGPRAAAPGRDGGPGTAIGAGGPRADGPRRGDRRRLRVRRGRPMDGRTRGPGPGGRPPGRRPSGPRGRTHGVARTAGTSGPHGRTGRAPRPWEGRPRTGPPRPAAPTASRTSASTRARRPDRPGRPPYGPSPGRRPGRASPGAVRAAPPAVAPAPRLRRPAGRDRAGRPAPPVRRAAAAPLASASAPPGPSASPLARRGRGAGRGPPAGGGGVRRAARGHRLLVVPQRRHGAREARPPRHQPADPGGRGRGRLADGDRRLRRPPGRSRSSSRPGSGRRPTTSSRSPRSGTSRRSCSCWTRSRIRRTSGTLLRTAEASGVHGAVFPTRRQAPLTPAAVKASAGAVEHLRLAPVDDLPGALADLHVRGLRIVGADGDAPLDRARGGPARADRDRRRQRGPGSGRRCGVAATSWCGSRCTGGSIPSTPRSRARSCCTRRRHSGAAGDRARAARRREPGTAAERGAADPGCRSRAPGRRARGPQAEATARGRDGSARGDARAPESAERRSRAQGAPGAQACAGRGRDPSRDGATTSCRALPAPRPTVPSDASSDRSADADPEPSREV